MNNYICVACGSQFKKTLVEPTSCPICEDDRQYITDDGQQWTTLKEMQQEHSNRIKQLEDRLYGIGTEPKFGIGQRAIMIQTNQGNVLWDCISLIDDQTIEEINKLGGLSAIAISHPHFYGVAVEWAKAFDVTVYLHEADRQWLMRPDSSIKFWQGDILELNQDLTLIRVGGHFAGATVCHWASGNNELGTLMSGDVIQVVADDPWVSFMYSYPNLIPLPGAKVEFIAKMLKPYAFDRLYGAWWDAVIPTDAHGCVQRSVERYLQSLEGNLI